MRINRNRISEAISSNDSIYDLFLRDYTFNKTIEMLCTNYELSEKQLVNIIFILCDGRKNTEDELVKYITRYGSLYEPTK